MLHLTHDPEENRLLRMSYGAASPLWGPFLLMAGMGAGFWLMTSWARRGLAGAEAPAGAAAAGRSTASPPAADRDLDPRQLDRPEQFMDHNVPPMEANRSEPEDRNPPPPVPAEHVLDHTPPESIDMPGNPVVEQRIVNARPSEADLGEEPGGEAAMLGETASALIRDTSDFAGDVRADDAAEPTPVLEDPADDGSDMADAAYAANFGPVLTPETGPAPKGGKPKGTRSRKSKVAPGTAPD